MLVSIIIGNYNYGHFVAEAIESALGQSYRDIEVIVIDDGSTDDSRGVIDRFGDRIKRIYVRNGGHAEVFNIGFRASSGQIICMLDADDYFFPSKVERVVSLYREHPEAEFVFHALNRVDATGAVLGREPRTANGQMIGHQKSRFFHAPPTTGTTYRREFLERIFPVPKPAFMGADNFTKFAAMATTQGYYSPEVLGVLRLHGSNHGSMGMPVERLLPHDAGIALALHQRLPHLRNTERLMGISFARYWLLRPRSARVREMLDEYLSGLPISRRIRLFSFALLFYLKRRVRGNS
jgi:glycosyltransferase involved in cell wall biosynthesis